MTRAEHHIRARINLVDGRQLPDLPPGLDNPFVFESESSNNNLDAYYTHMTEETLRNFASEAVPGVQFLDSHNNRNLGYGRTFNGRFEVLADRQPDFNIGRGVELAITPPAQYMRAVLLTYTVPGINFGGGLTYASTDDFIRAARAGIAKDISVGFYGGRWTCDICGGNYRSYRDCPHLAGLEYPLGEQGERLVIATVGIADAHLAEHSAVYDGATPQAMITKAERMAAAGELEPERKKAFEVRYKIALPRRVIVPGVTVSTDGQETAAEPTEENRMDLEQMVEDIRTILAETAAPAEVEPVEAVRWLADEVVRLRPLADAGRQYRADLIEAALAEGVRALGEKFTRETYQEMLAQSSIDVIKRMRDDWQQLGDARFAAGRATVDETAPKDPQTARKADLVPDAAYN